MEVVHARGGTQCFEDGLWKPLACLHVRLVLVYGEYLVTVKDDRAGLGVPTHHRCRATTGEVGFVDDALLDGVEERSFPF